MKYRTIVLIDFLDFVKSPFVKTHRSFVEEIRIANLYAQERYTRLFIL